jgi:hypothetical protein
MTYPSRMRLSLNLSFSASLLVASGASAQAYFDATNLSQAAGMLRAQVTGARTLEELCNHDFPDLGDAISSALDKWRNDDEQFISASNKFVAEMVRKTGQDPTPLLDGNHRRTTTLQYSSLNNDAQREYCHRFSADLGAGVWRSRTPAVYRLLEEYAKAP